MKEFAVTSIMNDVGFVVKIQDDSRLEEAKELALEGFAQWNDTDNHPEYQCCGWAEPAMILLEEAGIEYEIDNLFEEPNYDGTAEIRDEYKDLEQVLLFYVILKEVPECSNSN